MIRSFRSKALKRFASEGDTSKLSVENIQRLTTVIAALEYAKKPEDMDVSGWRFHALKGDKKGRYSVRVSGNWRVTFGWEGRHAVDIDLEDYH